MPVADGKERLNISLPKAWVELLKKEQSEAAGAVTISDVILRRLQVGFDLGEIRRNVEWLRQQEEARMGTGAVTGQAPQVGRTAEALTIEEYYPELQAQAVNAPSPAPTVLPRRRGRFFWGRNGKAKE